MNTPRVETFSSVCCGSFPLKRFALSTLASILFAIIGFAIVARLHKLSFSQFFSEQWKGYTAIYTGSAAAYLFLLFLYYKYKSVEAPPTIMASQAPPAFRLLVSSDELAGIATATGATVVVRGAVFTAAAALSPTPTPPATSTPTASAAAPPLAPAKAGSVLEEIDPPATTAAARMEAWRRKTIKEIIQHLSSFPNNPERDDDLFKNLWKELYEGDIHSICLPTHLEERFNRHFLYIQENQRSLAHGEVFIDAFCSTKPNCLSRNGFPTSYWALKIHFTTD